MAAVAAAAHACAHEAAALSVPIVFRVACLHACACALRGGLAGARFLLHVVSCGSSDACPAARCATAVGQGVAVALPAAASSLPARTTSGAATRRHARP
jgi:hypothetical protein